MMDMLTTLISRLHATGCSLVLASSAGHIVECRRRGVADLLQMLHKQPELLNGATIADKVVGKGAAALMVLGGVTRVWADVISRPALALLEASGVTVEYGKLVDNILNRRADGFCPVETLCLPCATAEECLPLIENFAASLKEK